MIKQGTMTRRHGRFCWYELLTTDTAGAAAFYGAVTGWATRDAGTPGVNYTLFLAGDQQIAGVMTLPQDAQKAGIPPCWLGYVAVDDVDASAGQAMALGGSIDYGPADVPGVGRFTMVMDPQGAAIVLFRNNDPAAPLPPARPDANGWCAWRELYSTDPVAGLAFYEALFGWTKSTPIDMGPMGTYQLYAHDGVDIGGMMRLPPGVPRSFWQYYVMVESISAAAARVTDAGGRVLNGPHPVSGGQFVITAMDPQGAVFALVSNSE